jgi:hypothetical protein
MNPRNSAFVATGCLAVPLALVFGYQHYPVIVRAIAVTAILVFGWCLLYGIARSMDDQ